MASPTIADIDQDYPPEIVLSGYALLHAYRPDGTKRFSSGIFGGSVPFPAVGDLDGDGTLEVVLGGDLLRVVKLLPISAVTHKFFVVNTASGALPYRFYGPPVLGDVDGDGQPEIVVWSIGDPAAANLWAVHVLDSATLDPLPGWPKVFPTGPSPFASMFVPALADLDGDGDMEIIHTLGTDLHVWDQPAIGTQGQPAPWPQFCHDGTGGSCFHRGNEPVPHFVRGDANGDAAVNVADVPFLLQHLFQGQVVTCNAAVDVDLDGSVGLPDAMLLLTVIFQGSISPPAPYPDCEVHPATELANCHRFACP